MKKNYTVKSVFKKEIDVEKSRFIGILAPLSYKEQMKDFILNVKKEYPNARHYCYALKTGDYIKYSDDGEPQGTAGKPILNVILNNNLNDVVLVVVRYFGGTLLGSGRLLRSYVNSTEEVVKSAILFQQVPKVKYRVEIEADTYNIFLNYLNKKHFLITNTSFNDKIIIDFLTDENFDEKIEDIFYGKIVIIGKVNMIFEEKVDGTREEK